VALIKCLPPLDAIRVIVARQKEVSSPEIRPPVSYMIVDENPTVRHYAWTSPSRMRLSPAENLPDNSARSLPDAA
jgi:hypothetical protein